MCQQGVQHLLIMGVHTNMCVLNWSFAIKQMVRWGVALWISCSSPVSCLTTPLNDDG